MSTQPSQKKYFILFSIIACSISYFYFLSFLTPQRVGDGSEYIALFITWQNLFIPWMTDISFETYQKLFDQHKILGLVPTEVLSSTFPNLKIGNEWDFNHFWFYSFLAVVCSKIFTIFGITLSLNNSFLILHFVLFVITVVVSYYFYANLGLSAIILLTITSPILWYSNKIHSEFFTYCLSYLSVIFNLSGHFGLSALMLAIASTQNISFALVAFVPFCFVLFLNKTDKISILDIMCLILTTLFVLLHPSYYFSRYGVITPQLVQGGASLGEHLKYFYIWLIDPDIGLLPNWLFGILVVIVTSYFCIRNYLFDIINIKLTSIIYFILFILINLFAHSSTENLNSGATTGVARYALWYLPLFVPLLLYSLEKLLDLSKFPLWITPIFILSILSNILINHPDAKENTSNPSLLSIFVQKYIPGLYNPPPEILAERYSGVGESVQVRAFSSSNPLTVVFGPDCRKFLIVKTGRAKSIIRNSCFIDADLPPNFHPATIRVSAFNTPKGVD